MILWVDAQLSPSLAPWITEEFGLEAASARRLGLTKASDREIFRAREAEAVVLAKDADFVLLLEQLGPPPLPSALRLVTAGEPLVEITEVGLT